MSEPMSSGDIEDVLSSIRRLISEDLRPIPRPGRAAEAEKLILTPALRIVPGPGRAEEARPGPVADQPEAPGQENSHKPEAEDIRPAREQQAWADEWPPEDEAAALEATPEPMADPGAVEDHSDTDGYDDEAADKPDSDLTDAPEGAALQADSDPRDDSDAVAPQADSASSHLSDVLSAIGSAVNEKPGEWESETGDSGFGDTGWRPPEWVEEAELVEDQPASEYAAPAEDDRARNDRAEAEAVAEILRAAEPETTPASEKDYSADADMFAEEDGFFDETVLRDLVRDLIREELSGTLGERITRNVRKLVRAEINRALTARDFD